MPLAHKSVAFKKSYGKPNENIALPAGRAFCLIRYEVLIIAHPISKLETD